MCRSIGRQWFDICAHLRYLRFNALGLWLRHAVATDPLHVARNVQRFAFLRKNSNRSTPPLCEIEWRNLLKSYLVRSKKYELSPENSPDLAK